MARVLGMSPRNGFLFLGFVISALLIGYVGSLVTMPAIGEWYRYLTLPPLNPPSSVFGPVWTTLYVLMGVAAFRVFIYAARAPKTAAKALTFYAIQLLVNLSWSFAFFGLRSPEAGLAVIIVLLLMIVWMMLLFFRIDRTAGILIIPYVAWVSFATYLNAGIMALN